MRTRPAPSAPSRRWTIVVSAPAASESQLKLPRRHLEVREQAEVATVALVAAAPPPATNATAAIAPATGLATVQTNVAGAAIAVIVREMRDVASSAASAAISSATAVVVAVAVETVADAADLVEATPLATAVTTLTILVDAVVTDAMIAVVADITDVAQAKAILQMIVDGVVVVTATWTADLQPAALQLLVAEVLSAHGTRTVKDHHLIAEVQPAATAAHTTLMLAQGVPSAVAVEDQDREMDLAHLPDAAQPTSSVEPRRLTSPEPLPTEILRHRIASRPLPVAKRNKPQLMAALRPVTRASNKLERMSSLRPLMAQQLRMARTE